MVGQIYPTELKVNKANTSDTKATILNLHLSTSNDIVSTKFTINIMIFILKLLKLHTL